MENGFFRVSSEKIGFGSGRVKVTLQIFGSGTGQVFCLISSGRVKFGSGNYPQHPYLRVKTRQIFEYLEPQFGTRLNTRFS